MRHSRILFGWMALALILGCQTAPQRLSLSPISTTTQFVLEMVGHEEQAWDVAVYHRRGDHAPTRAIIVEQIHLILTPGCGYERTVRIPTLNRVERIVVRRTTVREVIEPCFDRFCGHVLLSPRIDPWDRYLSDSESDAVERIFVEDDSRQAADSSVELQAAD